MQNARRVSFLVLAVAVFFSVLVPLQTKAAGRTKPCVTECKEQKDGCLAHFKAQFQRARQQCKRLPAGKPARKDCMRAAKDIKKRNKECKNAFRNECKQCCKLDPREQCSLISFVVCGDGMVEPGEQCDDGNLEDGDGCGSNCAMEPPTITTTTTTITLLPTTSTLAPTTTTTTTTLVPFSCRAGLPNAAGLDVSIWEPYDLYVKSGASGQLWKVEVASDGTLGAPIQLHDAMGTGYDVCVDAREDACVPQVGDDEIWCYAGEVRKTRVHGYAYPLTGSCAIETPGLPAANLLFFHSSYYPSASYIFSVPLQDLLSPDGSANQEHQIGLTCGNPRYLTYRPSRHDLVGSFGDKVKSISLNDASCTDVATGFTQAAGVAWDDHNQVLYVADSGAGVVYEVGSGYKNPIASNLAFPMDLVFHAGSGVLFVAEPVKDGVSKISIP